MRKEIILLLALMHFLCINASNHKVVVHISDGIDNEDVKTKIEQTISSILTEANKAFSKKDSADFSALKIQKPVRKSLSLLWNHSLFTCPESEIVEPVILSGNGYQVRHLPLMFKSFQENKDEIFQEAVARFDKEGNLLSFYISVEDNLYTNIVRPKFKDNRDLLCCQYILEFIEQLRTAYYQKDLTFLQENEHFSGIVPGMERNFSHLSKEEAVREMKKAYIEKLSRSFSENDFVNVRFVELEAMHHPVNIDFWGITIHQKYDYGKEEEGCYLFFLLDFRKEGAPMIHIATWQADMKDGKEISNDEVFSLASFDI